MPNYNLFGEIDEPIIIQEPEAEPEPVFEMPKPKHKKRKNFEIGICRQCGQLLLDDPENTLIKYDDELCECCDSRLRAKWDQFKNLALIRAARAHKR